jgi:DNA-binding transcriptional LysR family regulator
MPISTVSRRVAELEDQLSVRLLERSTRKLRLTDVGAEVLEHAQRSAELSEAVDNLASNQLSTVAGVLRLSAPPSISDTLLAPLLGAFQASYPTSGYRFWSPIGLSTLSLRGSISCFASAHLEIHRWSLGES